MGPTGGVRSFRWCHPEIYVGQGRQNLTTKISALITKKSGQKWLRTATTGRGLSVGHRSLNALVPLWALKTVKSCTQSYGSLSGKFVPCKSSTPKWFHATFALSFLSLKLPLPSSVLDTVNPGFLSLVGILFLLESLLNKQTILYSETRIRWHSLVEAKLSLWAGSYHTRVVILKNKRDGSSVVCHYWLCHYIQMSLYPGFTVFGQFNKFLFLSNATVIYDFHTLQTVWYWVDI